MLENSKAFSGFSTGHVPKTLEERQPALTGGEETFDGIECQVASA